jgi:hypothetical protein
MATVAFTFFDNILASTPPRPPTVNSKPLDLPRHLHLTNLGNKFTKEEVWSTIHVLPPDKTLGLDGFTVWFLQVAWPIILVDFMKAFNTFWHLDTWKFHAVSVVLMILVPRTTKASLIKDYHPISLIHVIGKLFSKIMANHLAPKLESMVHPCQSAIIKGRCIQENFKLVQASARSLHA